MTSSRASALAFALAIVDSFAGCPVSAQSCQGIRVEIGTGEQRCIQPGAGEPFKDCRDCPEMVAVPAASFMMGANQNEVVATVPEDQVRVTIARPFAVGRFAITHGEFAAFVAATGRKMDGICHRLGVPGRNPQLNWTSPGFAQDDRHPVVCVSWHDAKAYAAWLTSITGKQYRLLSEAEREFVTRAGSTTPFWWGSTISTDQANYDGRVTYAGGPAGEWRGSTVAVDSFLANPWGLFNVHGNVWEWTEDCWNEKNAGNPRRWNGEIECRLQPSRCARCILQQLSPHAARCKARAGAGGQPYGPLWISRCQRFLIARRPHSNAKRPAQKGAGPCS